MVPGEAAEMLIDAAAAPSGSGAPAATTVAPARPRRPVMRQYELVERVKSYDADADEDLWLAMQAEVSL